MSLGIYENYAMTMESVFTHTTSLKGELLKKVLRWIFFPSTKFVIVHSSTINPCQYSILVLEKQRF